MVSKLIDQSLMTTNSPNHQFVKDIIFGGGFMTCKNCSCYTHSLSGQAYCRLRLSDHGNYDVSRMTCQDVQVLGVLLK